MTAGEVRAAGEYAAYGECRLCPRDCGVNRLAGERGVCGETSECAVAAAEPHFGEEPCLSGGRGSGTIFFRGCSCGCFFCQNYQISRGGVGVEIGPEELYSRAVGLMARGVHNLNFVTGDHFWPHLAALARRLRAEGATIPLLLNTSGYVRPERVAEYARWMDIFLPDYKYADPELAQECMGDARYPELALAALREMVAAKGFLFPFDPSGAEPAREGVLVRHLVLPGHIENTQRALHRLREAFGPRLPLSVMSQYRPVAACRGRGPFERRLTREEHTSVLDLIKALEFEQVFVQGFEPDDAFLPDFERRRPFRGNRP
jgi:putative pyruvate formate lyase activating enzyme